jgi:hypothetical protein
MLRRHYAGERTVADMIWSFFVVRTDDFAEQGDDGSYHRVGRGLIMEDLAAHLSGKRTLETITKASELYTVWMTGARIGATRIAVML